MVINTDTTKVTRIVATYERVSSEDQRERDTIRTQQDELAKRLEIDPSASLFKRYSDNGITGTIPLADRPAGRQLFRDAENHLFNELWIYNLKRLGREKVDLLIIQRRFESLGIKFISLQEGELTGIGYDIQAIVADYDRKSFLKLSADGTNRAAREGRYTGGIVPLGFKVVGLKQNAHVEPNDELMWADQSEADIARRIYMHLTVDRWSCVRIAKEFNDLHIPTDYVHDNREVRIKGQRKVHTQGIWRASRIRNLAINPIYKGELQYGRRSHKQGREVIKAHIAGLVSEEIWNSAQEALARNRLIAKNTIRRYLLTGKIKCGTCGKTYCAVHGRGETHWWRCNGRMTSRYDADNRCKGKGIKSTQLEEPVWHDIEQWLRNPGELLRELEAECNQGSGEDAKEDQLATLRSLMDDLENEKKGYYRQNARGLLSDSDLQGFLTELNEKKAGIEKRLIELTPNKSEEPEPIPTYLLKEIRQKLDNGLSEIERQQIAELLIEGITIRTMTDDHKTKNIAEVEYRFPNAVDGAVNSCTGTDSSHRQAESWRDKLPSPGLWLS